MRSGRIFLLPAVAFAALAIFALQGVGFIRASAPTYDEAVHLASGYSGLSGASHCLNYKDHPPFGEMWAALPLLNFKPFTFFSTPDWLGRRVYHYADTFLYQNRISAERMLNAARLWCLLSWGALLAVAVLEWSLRLGGPVALAAAGVLFAFCPPLISNLALVTTDAPSAVFYFLTFWILSFRPKKRRHWIGAGVFMGLGLASKFNMILIPLFVAAAFLAEKNAGKDKVRFEPLNAVGMVLVAALSLWAAYRFSGLDQYWDGLQSTVGVLGQGRSSFLFGSYSTDGWFYYFPAALAIKTPIPLLVAAGAGFVLWIKSPTIDELWAALPPSAYFAAACLSKTQIGYRHILPIYPFLIIMGACAVSWAWRRSAAFKAVSIALGLWLGVGVVRVYPYYLSYFNEAVGGPGEGYRYLVDSNLDWGQDLKTLAAELARRGNPPVIFSYFGTADPAYYGIRYVPLGFVSTVERGPSSIGASKFKSLLLAVSVTNWQSVYYADKGTFAWLKAKTPVFIAGHSIFLYDLTGDSDGALHLAQMLARNGSPGIAQGLLLHYGHDQR